MLQIICQQLETHYNHSEDCFENISSFSKFSQVINQFIESRSAVLLSNGPLLENLTKLCTFILLISVFLAIDYDERRFIVMAMKLFTQLFGTANTSQSPDQETSDLFHPEIGEELKQLLLLPIQKNSLRTLPSEENSSNKYLYYIVCTVLNWNS